MLLADAACCAVYGSYTGGARIRHIFLEIFNKQLRQLDPMRELTDDDVRTAIKNSSGVSGELAVEMGACACVDLLGLQTHPAICAASHQDGA